MRRWQSLQRADTPRRRHLEPGACLSIIANRVTSLRCACGMSSPCIRTFLWSITGKGGSPSATGLLPHETAENRSLTSAARRIGEHQGVSRRTHPLAGRLHAATADRLDLPSATTRRKPHAADGEYPRMERLRSAMNGHSAPWPCGIPARAGWCREGARCGSKAFERTSEPNASIDGLHRWCKKQG